MNNHTIQKKVGYRVISGAFDRSINAYSPLEAIKLFSEYVYQYNGLIDQKTYLYRTENNPKNVYLLVNVTESVRQNKLVSINP